MIGYLQQIWTRIHNIPTLDSSTKVYLQNQISELTKCITRTTGELTQERNESQQQVQQLEQQIQQLSSEITLQLSQQNDLFQAAHDISTLQEENAPKAEVACGLVLDQDETRLTKLKEEDEDMFAGEDCIVNEKPIEWCDRLNLMQFENIDTFTVNSLRNLKQFLDDFHKALKEKRIQSIKPLKHYENEEWRAKLWRDVDRNVEAQLTNMQKRKAEEIRPEPPFIIGLKALLKQLSDKMNK